VRRSVAILAVFLGLPLIVGAILFAKYRINLLTPADLAIQQPEQKRVLKAAAAAEACSRLQLEFGKADKNNSKPIKSAHSLGADEISIYRAVLQRWVAKEKAALHVSSTTFPFTLDRVSCECLQGIELPAFLSASRSFHDLPSAALLQNMRLVDSRQQSIIVRENDPERAYGKRISVEEAVGNAFANGLFSMSEIVFDKEHLHAIVSYGFRCGLLCGSGSTIVFEKIGDEWKVVDRNCGGWIS
jgi:hypothetical protein